MAEILKKAGLWISISGFLDHQALGCLSTILISQITPGRKRIAIKAMLIQHGFRAAPS